MLFTSVNLHKEQEQYKNKIKKDRYSIMKMIKKK